MTANVLAIMDIKENEAKASTNVTIDINIASNIGINLSGMVLDLHELYRYFSKFFNFLCTYDFTASIANKIAMQPIIT